LTSLSVGLAAAAWPNFACLNQPGNKSYNICLNFVVGGASEELSRPHRAKAAVIKEVTPEYFQCLSSFGLAERRPKPNDHIFDSTSVVANYIIEIVCVLAISSGVEGQSLQRHEGAWTADRHVPLGLLPKIVFPLSRTVWRSRNASRKPEMMKAAKSTSRLRSAPP
jgi:hypothetical protein